MSKAEILEGIQKLTTEERHDVLVRLAELDGDEWLDKGLLTDAEKALIEERVRDLETDRSALNLGARPLRLPEHMKNVVESGFALPVSI